jgi:hypothetical protein
MAEPHPRKRGSVRYRPHAGPYAYRRSAGSVRGDMVDRWKHLARGRTRLRTLLLPQCFLGFFGEP